MTWIASHRGGAILWPENSPTAFRQTARLPVEQVEFDIHLSADGEVVVIHDPTLDRTTEAQGPVAARPLEALSRIRLKGTNGEAVPTLAAVVAIFAPTPIGLRMELKVGAEGVPYAGLLAKSAAVLAEAGLLGRTTVSSFRLELAAEAAADTRFGGRAIWLVSRQCWREAGMRGVLAAAQAAGVGAIAPHSMDCDEATVAACRVTGLSIGAYAGNGEETVRRLLGLGIDVFTTDDPVGALRLRQETRTPR
ncbi:glycerophosphodiester phosphodiesterase [Roseomonas aerophila]|uniref:Glycerophosphodiester phosphodiesterase n=1 Tax=Teichococcus aerophilus TaxID=1224513 RepID=A0ABR7RPW2_9PROT|nr:glycerophosphodiester phosphodiesterase family protein [Pseudoroseomonas aerophila]MBC9208640.1 glycerophosphodiester phosphodiesterase [Pseudoroseomonas aerophila]